MDTYRGKADYLRCWPETITILFGYTSRQNTKLKKKEIKK